jgi:hypothetical protein
MKQMSLIEMDGFLKGKCIPSDLKVNETNAEYLVRKFGELESKLETALRECRSAGITIDNLEAKCAALAAEVYDMKHPGTYLPSKRETPATDAFLAEVQAQGLNAFIQHHSAELDAHIKNGGEQFDEKSVRIRDIIVSARLFREQIRKEAAQ